MADDRTRGRPFGVPISQSIRVPTGDLFAPVRLALSIIDDVHGDGSLPTLPVRRTRGHVEVGSYEWDDRTGSPSRLSFSAASSHPHLTVIHEIGHFLDHQGMGFPGAFASE